MILTTLLLMQNGEEGRSTTQEGLRENGEDLKLETSSQSCTIIFYKEETQAEQRKGDL